MEYFLISSLLFPFFEAAIFEIAEAFFLRLQKFPIEKNFARHIFLWHSFTSEEIRIVL